MGDLGLDGIRLQWDSVIYNRDVSTILSPPDTSASHSRPLLPAIVRWRQMAVAMPLRPNPGETLSPSSERTTVSEPPLAVPPETSSPYIHGVSAFTSTQLASLL